MERKLQRVGIILLALTMILSAVSVGFAAEEAYMGEEELLENMLLPEDTTEDDQPMTRMIDIICSGDFIDESDRDNCLPVRRESKELYFDNHITGIFIFFWRLCQYFCRTGSSDC